MSPDVDKPAAPKPAGKDETQSSAGRKTSSARPQEPSLKCPRCDSPNTKFCYYNNYSLTQPRHFCKTCRRYWTKGGALRNVPIGGGCRKNKKLKSSPRLSGDSKDHSSGSSDHHVGGLKFFQGISPAMDFQLGGVNYPRIVHQSANTGLFSQFSQFGDLSNTCGAMSSSPCFNSSLDPSAAGASSPLMGFNFPFSNVAVREGNNTNNFQEFAAGSLNVPNSVATSIESLSCMNQDLHWKLQQQRLAMLFVGDSSNNSNNNQKEPSVGLVEKPLQPILFENLDISKPEESCGIGLSRKDGGGGGAGGGSGNLSTEWYFDNSYATVSSTPATTSSSNVNEMNNNNWSTSGGMQAWSDHMSHYTSLP